MEEVKEESTEIEEPSLENNKKKKFSLSKKARIIILILGCLFVILLSAVYLIFLLSHRDYSRNPYTKVSNSNIQLIQKNLMDGFKDTKESGKYVFKLSDEDINHILLNSTEELLPSKSESIYLNSSESMLYVDLKPTFGVPTRVRYNITNIGLTQTKEHIYQIITPGKMGKLPYVLGHHIKPEEFVCELSNRSGLPLSWVGGALVVSPSKLIEVFPSTPIKSFLNEVINAKPECLSIDPNSMFGFTIDFSRLNPNPSIEKKIAEELPDLYSRVSNSLTTEFLSSIPIGESKKACSIGVSDINKLISSKFSRFELEHALIDSSDVSVSLAIEDIYVSLTDVTHLDFVVVTSINDYKVYFNLSSVINSIPNKMIIEFELQDNFMISNGSIPKDSYIGTKLMSSLETILQDTSTSYNSYMLYLTSNRHLILDFTSIGDLIPGFAAYPSKIIPSSTEPDMFDLIVTAK